MPKLSRVLMVGVIALNVVATARRFAQSPARSLRDAVQNGDFDQVKKLLDEGADVNATAENKLTPIYFASDPRIVDLLLAHKPELNIRDSASVQTPLESAAERFYRDPKKAEAWRTIVQKLRVAGAEYTIDTAIYMNDVAHVQQQLEKDDSWVNKRPGAPLRIAVRTGREQICKLLLKHKADTDDFGRNGWPIMVDAINHPAVVRLLIDAGANLRHRITWLGGRSGCWIIGDEATALHFAAEEGNVESCRLLVKAGLDVNAADMEGQTPLHVALRSERFTASYEFVDSGKSGKETERFIEVVRYLLDHDASMRFTNKLGKTVLDVAKEIESPRQILILLRKREKQAALEWTPEDHE